MWFIIGKAGASRKAQPNCERSSNSLFFVILAIIYKVFYLLLIRCIVLTVAKLQTNFDITK